MTQAVKIVSMFSEVVMAFFKRGATWSEIEYHQLINFNRSDRLGPSLLHFLTIR